MVRDAVKYVLNRFNLHSQIEYRPLSHDIGADDKPKRTRPDGITPILSKMWDVGIPNRTCESYIKRHSAESGLVAAEIYEKRKAKKYDALAEKEGVTFIPLIFESFGGFGDRAREFICVASEKAVDISGGGTLERSDVLNYMRTVIAFAIVNGNARLIRNALLLAAKRPANTVNVLTRTVVSARGGVTRSFRRIVNS